MHVGQPEITSLMVVRESLVIEPHLMKKRRLEIQRYKVMTI